MAMAEDYSIDSLIDLDGDGEKPSRKSDTLAAELTEALQDLANRRLQGNFLLVESDGRYVQFWIDEICGEIYSEAVGNQDLPEIYQLGPDQDAAMNLLGFKSPDKVSLYYLRKWGKPEYFSPAVASSTALQVMREIYRIGSDEDILIIRGKR